MLKVYLGLLLLLPSSLTAQRNNMFIVSGMICDANSIPISNATVAVIGQGAEKITKFSTSDTTGKFFFEFNKKEDCNLHISAMGFKDRVVKVRYDDLDIVKIILERSYRNMEAVKVSSNKLLITTTDDKIVYNVKEDASSFGLTLPELLAKMPFVSVTGENAIQVNGKNNYIVLLNGRTTGMFSGSADIFKMFPAATIEKIEVITHPSAKYDADISGVINIITKTKIRGFNGTSSLNYNPTGLFNPNTSFNMKSGKLNFSSFAYFAHNSGYSTHGGSTFTYKNLSSPYLQRSLTDLGRNKGRQSGVSLELGYDLDSLTSLSLYGRMNGAGGSNTKYSDVVLRDNSNHVTTSNITIKDNLSFPAKEWGIDLIKKQKNRGEFSLSFNKQVNNNNLFVYSAASTGFVSLYETSNYSKAISKQTIISADALYPAHHSQQFELGIKAILRQINTVYSGLSRSFPDSLFYPDPANNNEFHYRQDVLACYISDKITLKQGYSMKVGARAERTAVDAVFKTSSDNRRQNYLSILPVLSISKVYKDNFHLGIFYSKKISRPGLNYLNPFSDNRDSLLVLTGNSKIKPELAHTIEISLAKSKTKFSYNLSFSATLSRSLIERYAIVNPLSGTTTLTYDNIGSSTTAGLSGFVAIMPAKELSIGSNFGLYYLTIFNKAEALHKRKGFYGSVNVSIKFVPGTRFSMYSTINFNAAPLQLEVKPANYLFYNLGSGYWIISKKLFLGIGLMNFIYRYQVFRSSMESAAFLQQTQVYRPGRAASVNVRYSFGKLKENTSRKKKMQIEDIKE